MSTKITKQMLQEKVDELTSQFLVNKNKIESYDSLKKKYNLIKTAREEDKTNVENANKLITSVQREKQDLINAFSSQIAHLQSNVSEQNETILTLFKMMDNSINQQIFYYNEFKSIFIKTKTENDNQS